MAVYREAPICEKCGERIKGVYKDQSDIPSMMRVIGDTFLRWDFEGHKCKEVDKTQTPIPSDLSKFIEEEAEKFANSFSNKFLNTDVLTPRIIIFKCGANLLLPIVQQLKEENEKKQNEIEGLNNACAQLDEKINELKEENEELKKSLKNNEGYIDHLEGYDFG